MSCVITTTTPRQEQKTGVKDRARNAVRFTMFTCVAVAASALCLKARPAPYVWLLSVWACTLIGLTFRVRRSWPRALLFNASVAAATLALAEIYYSLHEFEAPIVSPKYIVQDK